MKPSLESYYDTKIVIISFYYVPLKYKTKYNDMFTEKIDFYLSKCIYKKHLPVFEHRIIRSRRVIRFRFQNIYFSMVFWKIFILSLLDATCFQKVLFVTVYHCKTYKRKIYFSYLNSGSFFIKWNSNLKGSL